MRVGSGAGFGWSFGFGAGVVGVCRYGICSFLLLDGRGDGLKARGRVSARRPRYFSLLRQRKVSKRKATLLSATPTLRCGATWVGVLAGWAAELALLLRSAAQTAAASQITKRLHPSVQPPPRQHPAPGAYRRAWGTTRAIAALGLGSAGAARRATPRHAAPRGHVLGIWSRAGNAFRCIEMR